MNLTEAIKTAATTLVIIAIANQIPLTRPYVQKALTGTWNYV